MLPHWHEFIKGLPARHTLCTQLRHIPPTRKVTMLAGAPFVCLNTLVGGLAAHGRSACNPTPIPDAGAPFVCLNTLVGGLAAYGLAGLRPEPWAVAQFALMLVLQSLVAIQVMVLSVYITPNQARPRARRVGTLHPAGAQGLLPSHSTVVQGMS